MGKSIEKRRSLSQLVDDLLKACSSLKANGNPNVDFEQFQTILPIVNKILKLENDKAGHWQHNRDTWIPKVLKWAECNGIVVKNLDIKFFGNFGYGLCATKVIPLGEEIIKVPRNIIFTPENIPRSELDELILNDPLLSQMPQAILALKLMFEYLNPESKWSTYIMSLPTSYNIPLFMEMESLELMKRSPSLITALMQCWNIARLYAYIFKLLKYQQKYPTLANFERHFCLAGFRWAMGSVITRQNVIPDRSNLGDVICLIPVWDMCNHEDAVITTSYCSDSNQTICKTHRGYGMGDQVFIHYGNRSNGEFLVNNGFVYLPNKHDVIEVKLGLNKNDTLYNLKTTLINKLSLPTSGNFKLHQKPIYLDKTLLAFLRINCMDKDMLTCWDDERDNIESLMSPLEDNVLDHKVMDYFITRLKLLIKSYPTSPEETTCLISSDSYPDDSPSRLPILLRYTEQKILSDAVQFLTDLRDAPV